MSAYSRSTTSILPFTDEYKPGNSDIINMTSYASSSNTSTFTVAFAPISIPHLLVTSCILGLMILATIIGNVFVIAAIILERNLHNVANYLILSLGVADLMVASLVMPLAAVNEVSRHWFLGGEACDLWVSLDVLCCTSSIMHLVFIALDRYWAVTQVDYIHNRSARSILLMIVLSWLSGGLIALPPLFGWKTETTEEQAARDGVCLISQDWGYTIYSTIGAFYLPLSAMVLIYIKIYNAARKSIRKKNFKMHRRKSPKRKTDHTSDASLLGSLAVSKVNHVETISLSESGIDASSNGSVASDANKNNKAQLLMLQTPPVSPAKNGIPTERNQLLDPGGGGVGTCNTGTGRLHMNFRNFRSLSPMISPKRRHKQEREYSTKERLEQKRERKAARTLAVITGSFVACWLPFFIVAVVRPFCGELCKYPDLLMGIIGWLGYFNSLLNPIIYTIFNPDFRSAFQKILFGKYRNSSRRR